MPGRTTPSDLHTELEKRILTGLSCEWDAAASLQEHHTGCIMRKPLLALREMRRLLGVWSPEKREIALSRDFVLNHSWDAVREVLLHEMAHQYAHEILNSENEPPHGTAFRKACHILKANPEASGRYAPLDERINREMPDDDNKMVVKIRKLLALSESSNRHEAEAAMKKAHEMIGRYNVDLLKLREKRRFVSIFIGKPALRHHREAYHLARLIQDFYFVQGIWVCAFVINRNKMGRVLEISGTRHNVRIAAYVHDYIHHYIDAQWRIYRKQNPKKLNRYRKTDFAVGVIEGFYGKLSDASKAEVLENPMEQALTRLRDPQLDRYIQHRYPHLHRVAHAARSRDAAVISDGMQLGRKLVISRGITERKNSGKLLER